MARFFRLGGDVNWSDYGGTWYRRVGPGRYHIMELINWIEACGEREAKEIGATYNVSLSEVDVAAASDKVKEEAKRSCGWEGMEEQVNNVELMWAEVLFQYGYKAPLWDKNGNNYSLLMKEAREESASLDDPEAHEAAMNRPVNKIGSTAREFMQGDFASAMDRGVREGRTDAKIMAKMHGVPDDVIEKVEGQPLCVGVSFSVKMRGTDAVPSDDPLAFTMGYMHARAGQGLDHDRKDLASEYVRGYQLGVDVKAGRAPKPEWHK